MGKPLEMQLARKAAKTRSRALRYIKASKIQRQTMHDNMEYLPKNLTRIWDNRYNEDDGYDYS